jgi:methylenetetrahydrofolate reductase (NADPH)
MKVIDLINEAKETRFSIEILPPLKGQNIAPIFEAMDELMVFEPAFVDVTYHREEYVYRDVQNGLLEKRTVRKRPGTVGICSAIKHRYNTDPVPHIICGGFTKDETEDALLDLNYVGIENVLVLRGDAIRSEGRYKAEPGGHAYSYELVEQVVDLNNGRYLDPELRNSTQTNFCIGVAGYPEKHFEAPNPNADLRYLKQKVDSGAEYVITQMFFDNAAYFDYVERCREAGITVPIIPGLKPLTAKSQLTSIPQNFFVNLPDELVSQVERAKSKSEVEAIGIEWCIAQCRELKNAGVPVLHFFTMGKSKATKAVAEAIF